MEIVLYRKMAMKFGKLMEHLFLIEYASILVMNAI